MVTVNMHKSNNLRQCRTLQTFKAFKPFKLSNFQTLQTPVPTTRNAEH
jgi:hypothetical protein